MKKTKKTIARNNSQLKRCTNCLTDNFRRSVDPETLQQIHPSVGECLQCGYTKAKDEFYEEFPYAYSLTTIPSELWEVTPIQNQDSYGYPDEEILADIKATKFYPLPCKCKRNDLDSLHKIIRFVKGVQIVGGYIQVSNNLIQVQEMFLYTSESEEKEEMVDIWKKLVEVLPTISCTEYYANDKGELFFQHNGFAVFHVEISYWIGNNCSTSFQEILGMHNVVAIFTQGYNAVIFAYVGCAKSHDEYRNRCMIFRHYLMDYSQLIVAPLGTTTEVFHPSYDPGIISRLSKKKMMNWCGFLEKFMPQYL